MNLSNLISNLEAFDFTKERDDIVKQNKDKLADLQAGQFAHGIDAKGKPIELLDNPQYDYGYRPFTIAKKQRDGVGLGKVTDHVTFYGTGLLYKNLETVIKNSTFEIASKVSYWSVLIRRTQTSTTLLSEDSRRDFANDIVLPEIRERLNSKVFNR